MISGCLKDQTGHVEAPTATGRWPLVDPELGACADCLDRNRARTVQSWSWLMEVGSVAFQDPTFGEGHVGAGVLFF